MATYAQVLRDPKEINGLYNELTKELRKDYIVEIEAISNHIFNANKIANNPGALSKTYANFTLTYNQIIELLNPITPVNNMSINSGFKSRGSDGPGRVHEGIDTPVPMNTDIKAVAAGVVSIITLDNTSLEPKQRGYGNMIIIDHGKSFTTRYAHLSKFLVKKGDTVAKGQVIAKSGNSGHSTGPHLHFEFRYKNIAVDPNSYYKIGKGGR